MPDTITLDSLPHIPIALRPVARARSLSLRVSSLDGQVTLSMPARLPRREALAFLHSKEAWLQAALARVPARVAPAPGQAILLRGEMRRIVAAPVPRIREAPGEVQIPETRAAQAQAQLAAYLKASARAALVPAAEGYARALRRPITAISLRDTRSRWGSCTAQGRLMFSWRLIMAPPRVLDYVAAHEVAHLAHMDHSRAFWDCVAGLMPDYREPRAWLRGHGAELHRYCFTARPTAESG